MSQRNVLATPSGGAGLSNAPGTTFYYPKKEELKYIPSDLLRRFFSSIQNNGWVLNQVDLPKTIQSITAAGYTISAGPNDEVKEDKSLRWDKFPVEIQMLALNLLDPKTLEAEAKEHGMSPLAIKLNTFLSTTSIGNNFCNEDATLTSYGNDVNKSYVSMLSIRALQSVLDGVGCNKLVINTKLDEECIASALPPGEIHLAKEGEKLYFITRHPFKNYEAKDTIKRVEIEESKDFPLLKDTILSHISKAKELPYVVSEPALVEVVREYAAMKDATLGVYNIIDKLSDWKLSRVQFTNCLSQTRWNSVLVPYSAKLFHLSTSLGAMTDLPIMQYLQLLNWLGDPALKPDQAMPATIAIDLYFQILTKNVTAQKLFRGFVSRAELDRLTDKDKMSLGPVVRFNDGRLSFDEKNNAKHFHRNLVLSDYDDKAAHHKMMFAFDARTGVVKEADESWKTRYVRRKTQPKPRDSRELDIDFRQILTAFNTALRPTGGTADGNNTPVNATICNLHEISKIAFALAYLRDDVCGRKQDASTFDPQRGNKI